MVKIVIDAMGGDYAPEQQVLGAVKALNKDKDLSLILCGDEPKLKELLSACKYDTSRLEIVHTTEIIDMNDIPTKAVKTKKDSSTVVAFRLLKEGKADGLVSSGSTGAVLTAGVLILGRLKGVSRPALCPIIPNKKGTGTFICDCGANLECKPINLQHFAIMASAYAESAYGIKNPKVGLLNNGTEDHKGLALQQEVNALLKEMDCINYVGNVEGRDLMYGDIDVMVADGFSGNIATKAVEGCGKTLGGVLKQEYKRNLWSKICAVFSMGVIKRIKKSMDYEAFGGAMFLGLSKAVVKGHGNSKEKGFAVCIEQAANAVRGNMVEKIKAMIDSTILEQPKTEEAKE
ncbi:MAG: phosphate acyltransferase PlsX [Clostridia bacterium]|nr:phosphate acyltransferase PlsX [Clostridia bacterium]